MSTPRPVPLFLVFALGYFFSALLRAVTATLAPEFSAELGLSAADLGLLAGVFFAGFASTQLPLGSALDRFGPKRVLLAFMAVGVLSCAAFALARSFETLLLARTLMGVGLSASLMAALTAFRHAYDPATQFRATSWMLMTGSLGMLASTLPTHALLPVVGWRGLFWLAGVALILCALLLAWIVPADAPSRPRGATTSTESGWRVYLDIWRHPTFARVAPIGFVHYGGLIAVQTLWAGPWLTEVCRLTPQQAAQGLFFLNFSMLCGFAALGVAAPRWAAAGWGAERLVRWVAPFSAALLAIIALAGEHAGPPAIVLWCVSCIVLSLSQPAVGQAFSAHQVGRALSAFNLVIFLGVFAVQWSLGLLIDALIGRGWPRDQAHQAALFALAMACLLSYARFRMASPSPRSRESDAPAEKGAE